MKRKINAHEGSETKIDKGGKWERKITEPTFKKECFKVLSEFLKMNNSKSFD